MIDVCGVLHVEWLHYRNFCQTKLLDNSVLCKFCLNYQPSSSLFILLKEMIVQKNLRKLNSILHVGSASCCSGISGLQFCFLDTRTNFRREF